MRARIDEARDYSANGGAWLASSAWAHRWWLPRIEGFSEVLFPGVLATVLGLAGLVRGLRRPASATASPRPAWPAGPVLPRDVVLFYAARRARRLLGVVRARCRALPRCSTTPCRSSRSSARPARIGIVVPMALVVLASAVLAPWLRARPRPALWTAALVLLAALELNGAPLTGFRDAPPIPEAYRMLARLPRGAVAEFPYFYRRGDFPRHAEYMLGSTVHFQPLINGYSDHIPADWRENVVPLSSFPTRESFGILGRIGARYVVFHLRGYDRRSRERLLERLQTYGRFLRPLVQQDDVWLYEIVDWPN